jgi:hypothetical protein
MGRCDRRLPSEFTGDLTFGDLAGVLESLAGEDVSVRISSGASASGIIEVFGTLTRSRSPEMGHLQLLVGDAGYLRLDEREIARITMATMDGNDYFQIVIEVGGATVAIADRELQGLAVFEGS